ncbi:hypothetical protein HanHA300_Chr08g0291461 [Helianthus annuus]|nr:hypothetical protein HanHA300_Chr08g0291461 [Helianthus annuus]
MKVFLKEAGLSGFKIHYLGGLSLLISFEDDIDVGDFLLNVSVWSRWFSSVDMWARQTMQYERVAWLKFHGMLLHLAENKVFDDVAGMFGKVIQKSQLSLEDNDLSVNFVGILVDHGNRISDSVTVKWKNKRYKIWILEERDEWVPDYLSEEDWPEDSVGDDVSVDIPKSGNEKSEKAGEEVGEPLSQNLGNVGIEGNSTFHEVGKSAGVGDSQVNVGLVKRIVIGKKTI